MQCVHLSVRETCSLRLGRMAIPYLSAGKYFGIEPEAWLIADGFMELRHAPRLWRRLVLSWAALLAIAISFAL